MESTWQAEFKYGVGGLKIADFESSARSSKAKSKEALENNDSIVKALKNWVQLQRIGLVRRIRKCHE
jgi:hypothetical protein